MSGPVDVLAVLDESARLLWVEAGKDRESNALLAATAAVAELIEALRMSDEWIREAVNFGGCKLKSEQTLFRNSQALANIGGAK